MRLFSYRDRPVHLGPFPLERLPRTDAPADLSGLAAPAPLSYDSDDPASILPAMGEYAAMLDAIRDGAVKPERAEIPSDPQERSNHLKAFGHYCDASMVGVCALPDAARLAEPHVNPGVAQLGEDLRTKQTKTLAAGIDVIMAELKEAASRPLAPLGPHRFALVFLYEHPRDPVRDEEGCEWILNAQAQRSALRASETASILSVYLRLLGYEARAHTASASDVDLNALAVAAGLARPNARGRAENPYVGDRFALAAVTTTLELAPDDTLAAETLATRAHSHGPAWWLGKGFAKSALNRDPYRTRRFMDGPHAFETLKRVEDPTTFIDEPNVARVPKRTDMFARAQFGDMGTQNQQNAKAGGYVRKSASGFAFRPALGAFVLLGDGEAAPEVSPLAQDPKRNAANIKAASYWLGADAVGLSRCPDWTYYSHDAAGNELAPYHSNAISMIIDQGHETMEGASGDDWISVAQSMRAYLRFALLGGVLAAHIRRLGYTARVHTVMDGEVLQPPLLLLSGLGEVSRIGEVILNPFLGPRLKSGVVTTDMPMEHDKPIDFGLQKFCEACNKCARECPSGAITAGPKLMFNGYEIWKSDSQRCTTYRIGTLGGAMCGRCMKTCPWNLEGVFAEKPVRWAAMNFPRLAPRLAKFDDDLGRGGLNPVKKWWWDLEMVDEGPYKAPENPVNERGLQPDLDLKYKDQTLAIYPAPLAPHPWPWPFPMDREKGVEAYRAMISAEEHRARSARGEAGHLHVYSGDQGEAPVLPLAVSRIAPSTPDITIYEFTDPSGAPLPPAEAGAHLDVLVAPEFLRAYSLSGDPADRSRYQIAVLREDEGRGGSKLLHRIFAEGRRVFVSRPLNHFPLDEDAPTTLLMAGGVGVTPMLAMAHRLHALGRDFALHYSAPSREAAAFLAEIEAAPWADRAHLHLSDEGSRADLAAILADPPQDARLYLCGPERYMTAVQEAAAAAGWPEESVRQEYFAVPEEPERENHPFTLRLAKSGRDIAVAADQAATDALAEAGVHVDVKCSDGLCGVCRCGLVSGEVDHRDFVLTKSERAGALILCRSRAAEAGGVIEVDL